MPPDDPSPCPRRYTRAAPFVALAALLLASFPARNTDAWVRLAAGQQLLGGTDPGRAGGDSPLGFRPGWLFDVTAYAVYAAAGGGGLVVVKAVLVVVLAVTVFRLGRAGAGPGLAAACTALGVLAMSLRLLLQPVTVSYLLLAAALWYAGFRPAAADKRRVWPLAAVFALWANLDYWVLLGFGVVALVWLGRTLDRTGTGRIPRALLRGLVFAGLVAAFLLTRARYTAFAGQVNSPFGSAYLGGPGSTPAGLAYFPLLGLGLVSFALNRPGWRWERFLPWAALAALSAVQVRTVPFFAVVAAPVMAWNLHDWLARRPGRPPAGAPLRWLGRVAAAAFLVCAWPGWLQGPPYEPRSWAVEVPAPLRAAAGAVRGWRAGGQLDPAGRGLHLSAESAAAFTLLDPEDRGVRDAGLVARVLDPAAPGPEWAGRLRAAGVTHLIAYDPDRGRWFGAMTRLLAAPDRWRLLHLEGNAAVFGWRDAAGPADPFPGLGVDIDRLAFRPDPDEVPAARRPAAPPRRWWEAFYKAAPPRSAAADEAAVYLFQAEVRGLTAPHRHLEAWEACHAAAAAGAAAAWHGPAGGLLDSGIRLTLFQPPLDEGRPPPPFSRHVLAAQQRFTRSRDDAPPALFYLALRAARRAVAASPDDARAYFLLGDASLGLLQATRERAWAGRLPEVAQLRRAQAAAALARAVALDPDFAEAHLRLGRLYRELGYLDLAAAHLRAYRRLVQDAGPRPGVNPSQFRQQMQPLDQELDRMAKGLEEGQKAFAAEAPNLRVLDRARLAAQHGLAGKARDVLLASDVAAFGAEGMALELELLLGTGRAKDVLDWTAPEQQAALGDRYYWIRARAFAAAGDYPAARDECKALAAANLVPEPMGRRGALAAAVGRAVLDARPGSHLLPDVLTRAAADQQFLPAVGGLVRGAQQEADATVLRGLLALEEGDVGEAESAFRAARAVWGGDPGAGGAAFPSQVIAHEVLRWLESGSPPAAGSP